MTISEQIDRSRRQFAATFQRMPFGVALSRSQINDLKADRLGRSRLTRHGLHPQAAGEFYGDLGLYELNIVSTGPMILDAGAIVTLTEKNIISPL